jgi:hypothetical protein
MTTWLRDRTLRHCGQCGAEIPADTVLLRITFGSCKAKKYRCATCAGPAPPDLPAVLELDAPPPPIDLTRIGLLPLDFKRRQSGEEG